MFVNFTIKTAGCFKKAAPKKKEPAVSFCHSKAGWRNDRSN